MKSSSSWHSSHPDYEDFCNNGSPLNFLSRHPCSNGFFGEDYSQSLQHYSKSQVSFAQHCATTLIKLHREFDPTKIFDYSSAGISDDEVNNIEKLYQQITEERMMIAEKTSSTFDKLNLVKFLREINDFTDIDKMSSHPDYEKQKKSLKLSSYRDSCYQYSTGTALIKNSQYSKYLTSDVSYESLRLSHIVKLLGEELLEEDNDIILGELQTGKNPKHMIGGYRESLNDGLGLKVDRVDKITALAAKKALMTEDEDEALKYAFIFGTLRGLNVRSTIGACFAQEMSMRWIFDQKGWPQFNKTPGTYLDIEACLLNKDDPDGSFAGIIAKQVSDYKASLNPDFIASSSSLFDLPNITNHRNDFTRYLIETRKYRAEDLSDIIYYHSSQVDTLNAFEIAAKNGDRKFFQMLSESSKHNIELKKEIRGVIRDIDWSSVVEHARQYGDKDAMKEIENFKRDFEVPKSSFCSSIVSYLFGDQGMSMIQRQIEGDKRKTFGTEKLVDNSKKIR